MLKTDLLTLIDEWFAEWGTADGETYEDGGAFVRADETVRLVRSLDRLVGDNYALVRLVETVLKREFDRGVYTGYKACADTVRDVCASTPEGGEGR